jgi:hypothetical protein
MTIALPTVAATSCDDSPTVNWYAKAVDSNTYTALTTNDHVTSTTDTTIVFDSAVWDWGDVDSGLVY